MAAGVKALPVSDTLPSAEPDDKFGKISSFLEGKGIQSSSTDIEPRDFFWDQLPKYAASGMIALTIIEVLSTLSGESVKCLTPHAGFTRDQSDYINNYCDRHAPPAQYYPLALVVQAICIVIPHFLWVSLFYGQFQDFFYLATELDRRKDNLIGDYALKNSLIVKNLDNKFGKGKKIPWIFLSYLAKLILQVLFVVAAFGVNGGYFAYNKFLPSFPCPPPPGGLNCTSADGPLCITYNDSVGVFADFFLFDLEADWPFKYQVNCVLSTVTTFQAVWILNIILLIMTILAHFAGIVWSVMRHTEQLNWKETADFIFHSGLEGSEYRALGYLESIKKREVLLYRITSDFKFLLLKLHRHDAGIAKVFHDLVVDNFIKDEIQAQHEVLSYYLKTQDEKIILTRKRQFPPQNNQDENEIHLGDRMESFLHYLISHKAFLTTEKLITVNVTFCSNVGYLFPLAWKSALIVLLKMNSDFINEEKPVDQTEYGVNNVYIVNSRVDIFGQGQAVTNKFEEAFFPCLKNAPDMSTMFNANLIIIGPIYDANREVTVDFFLHMLHQGRTLDSGAILITLMPVKIRGSKPVREYISYEPKRNWKLKDVYFSYQKGEQGCYFNYLHLERSKRGSKSNGSDNTTSSKCLCPPQCCIRMPLGEEVGTQEQSERRNKENKVRLDCGGVDCIFQVGIYTFAPGHSFDPKPATGERPVPLRYTMGYFKYPMASKIYQYW